MTREPAATRSPIRAVMIFARDPQASYGWYGDHVLGVESFAVQSDSGFWFIEAGGVEVGFHPADDERNPFGASVVLYFATTDLTAHRERLIDAGATHHRGPLAIDATRSICQLVDPFGTAFGLDGPA